MEKQKDIAELLLYGLSLYFAIFGSLTTASLITLVLIVTLGSFLIRLYINACEGFNGTKENKELVKLIEDLKKIEKENQLK